MAAQFLTTRLNLPATPQMNDSKNPDIYTDLISVHNAINLLAQVIDYAVTPKVVVTAAVTLTAGLAVHIYSNAGVLSAEYANATGHTKPCHGFAMSSVAAGATVEIQLMGLNELVTGLTPGTSYYLSTTNGLLSAAPAAAAGNLSQFIGIALAANAILYRPASYYKEF